MIEAKFCSMCKTYQYLNAAFAEWLTDNAFPASQACRISLDLHKIQERIDTCWVVIRRHDSVAHGEAEELVELSFTFIQD